MSDPFAPLTMREMELVVSVAVKYDEVIKRAVGWIRNNAKQNLDRPSEWDAGADPNELMKILRGLE